MDERYLQSSEAPPKIKQASPVKLDVMAIAGVTIMGFGVFAQQHLFARGSDPNTEPDIVTGAVEPLVVRDAPRYADFAKRPAEEPEVEEEGHDLSLIHI